MGGDCGQRTYASPGLKPISLGRGGATGGRMQSMVPPTGLGCICLCLRPILPASCSVLHTYVVSVHDWLCPKFPWLNQPCTANVRPLTGQWAKPPALQKPGSRYYKRTPHCSGPSCIGTFCGTLWGQRSGFPSKGSPATPWGMEP